MQIYQQHLWSALTTLTCFATARTLKQALAQHGSLSQLHDILQHLDLLDGFARAENVTLLAMTDAAILFLADWGINLTTTNPEVARSILQYHFLEGAYSSAAIGLHEDAQLIPSMLRPPHFTNVTNGPVVKLMRGDSRDSIGLESGLQNRLRTEEANVYYDGGIIHTIDRNLVLPHNLSETSNVGGLDEFWHLVEKSGSRVGLESLKDATFLIPSNNAIWNARPKLNMLTPTELAEVICNHALDQVLYHSAVGYENDNYATLYGDYITIRKTKHEIMIVNDVQVSRQDVLVYGGVAHIIDSVLIPEKLVRVDPSRSTTEDFPMVHAYSLNNIFPGCTIAWLLGFFVSQSVASPVFHGSLVLALYIVALFTSRRWQDAHRRFILRRTGNGGDSARVISRSADKDDEPCSAN